MIDAGTKELVWDMRESTVDREAAGSFAYHGTITLPEGKVYFACDTGLFSDMQLIGEEGIELAVLPIGDLFTMGPESRTCGGAAEHRSDPDG